jgi:hypothetical protein
VDPAGGGHEQRYISGRMGPNLEGFAPFPDQRYILTTTGPDRAPDPSRPALGPWGRWGAPGGPFRTHPNWPVGGVGFGHTQT